jgi:hypothetical protein
MIVEDLNWEMVCKPNDCGGLGILNLIKFSAALRMRWLWREWNEEAKPWAGLGTPCTPQDVDLFAAATRVNIANAKNAPFREASWVDGRRYHAPYFLSLEKEKMHRVQGLGGKFSDLKK